MRRCSRRPRQLCVIPARTRTPPSPAALGIDATAPLNGTALFYTAPGPFDLPNAPAHAPGTSGSKIAAALTRDALPLTPRSLAGIFARYGGNLSLASLRVELDRLLPPAPLPLINSEEALRETCTESPLTTLCMIAFLPGPLQVRMKGKRRMWEG